MCSDKKYLYLPQTISRVQANKNVETSKVGESNNFFRFRIIKLVFSLKMGMNEFKIFRLNVEFNIFLCGLHILAKNKNNNIPYFLIAI